jgi:hypothetical protein
LAKKSTEEGVKHLKSAQSTTAGFGIARGRRANCPPPFLCLSQAQSSNNYSDSIFGVAARPID